MAQSGWKQWSAAVDAGPNITVKLPTVPIRLLGSVADDGNPYGSHLTSSWTSVSGPGTVSFVDSTSPSTKAIVPGMGIYVLQLTASDGALSTSAIMVLNVLPADANAAPVVDAGHDRTVDYTMASTTLHGSVFDDGLPVGGMLTSSWSQISGPPGVQFNDLYQLDTTVSFPEPGLYVLRLTANDGELTSMADVTINVAPVNHAPIVSAGADQSLSYPTNSTSLNGAVHDDGLPVGATLTYAWSVSSGPGPVTFGAPHALQTGATFSYPGSYDLRLTASDSQLSGTSQVHLTIAAMPGLLPVVTIASPVDGARITTPAPVVASVSEGAWKLEVALDADDSTPQTWRSLAAGVGALSNATIANFDPTMMLNGSYSLRLTATTAAGDATAFASVTVDKNMKVGNVALTFVDMVVPLTGLPIRIVRSYDSRDPRGGDFGAGWSLAIQDVRLEKSAILGKFWQETEEGSFALPSYCLKPLRPAVVTVTFPTGKVYRFQSSTDPQCQPLAPIETVNLGFTPLPGTVGQLAAADAQPTAFVQLQSGIPGPVTLTDTDGQAIYNPSEYVLTVEDGTQYLLRQGSGVEQITDRSGNTLQFTRDGILSSTGRSVIFARNADGRITQITDLNGNSTAYGYDADGNLSSFIDRTGKATTFGYTGIHKLATITDALGKTPLTNGYDPSSGRLSSTTDAFGKAVQFTHQLDTHREEVTNRNGSTTSYEYDDDGNVVKLTDALLHTTTATFDANDNKLTETDALNRTTTWTYDGLNHQLSQTDPLGHTTSWTYDQYGGVLTMKDPLGNVTTNERATLAVCGQAQPSGALLSTTDAKGNKTSYTYDCQGQLLSQTDARGGITGYGYDSLGRATSTTDALGNVTAFSYDANGNQLTESRTRVLHVYGVADTNETILTQQINDKEGRRTGSIYPDGSTSSTVYTASGKPAVTTDQLGRQTTYQYDDQGQLILTTFPDATSQATTYDFGGRRATSVDRQGRTTAFDYDQVGRLTTTTAPDNTIRTTVYDEVGRVWKSIDELGQVTQNDYDAAGRRSLVTDALTHQTMFYYDDAGNQTSVVDANGNGIAYEYDSLSRQTKTVYPDHTFELTGYDATGNRSTRQDQSGLVTRYGYDLLGRLTSVTDPLLQVTAYSYDELGNRISQTDANNHTTTFAYDSMGRRLSRTLPDLQTEHFAYYASGELWWRKDFNGRTTTYAYEPNTGRLLSKTPDAVFQAAPISYTYYASGRRKTMTDPSGTTSYGYDARDRLMSKATPEGTLSYTYDDAGNRRTAASDTPNGYSVSYDYDLLNRLKTVTDHGQATAYHYDQGGRLHDYSYPNGLSTVMTYDSLNRVQNVALAAGTTALGSYAYGFYPTGNRSSVTELSGRTASWQYDNLWRLTNETIAGSAVAGAVGYSYDAVGNRRSRTSTVPGIGSTSDTFDPNDELAFNYAFDSNGNLTQDAYRYPYAPLRYGYDFEDHLSRTDIDYSRDHMFLTYDGDGNRVVRFQATCSPTCTGPYSTYLIDDATPTGYAQVAEENLGGALSKVYAYGLQRISMRDSAAGVHYYGYDAHSGVRLLTDASGAVTDTWDYDAFGNLISRTGTTANDFTYRGEQMDPTLGFQYLRARWMDPSRGRFLTADRRASLATVLGSGLYRYGGCNPVNRVDASGRFDLADVVATVALVGVVASIALAPAYNPIATHSGQDLYGFSVAQSQTLQATFGSEDEAAVAVLRVLMPKTRATGVEAGGWIVDAGGGFRIPKVFMDGKQQYFIGSFWLIGASIDIEAPPSGAVASFHTHPPFEAGAEDFSDDDMGGDDRAQVDGYLGVSETGVILKHAVEDPETTEIANFGH